jgi:hypothetical protein
MPAIQEALNLGDLLKFEDSHLYSRDQVTVLAGEVLPLGAVVGQVTATGKVKALDLAATDGSAVACGVLIAPQDALFGDQADGLMIARHAIVADHALTWPAGLTPLQKDTALSQLKALGILVRTGA